MEKVFEVFADQITALVMVLMQKDDTIKKAPQIIDNLAPKIEAFSKVALEASKRPLSDLLKKKVIEAASKLEKEVKDLLNSKTKPAKVTLLIVKEILLTVANIFILEDEGNISILAKQAKDLGKSIEQTVSVKEVSDYQKYTQKMFSDYKVFDRSIAQRIAVMDNQDYLSQMQKIKGQLKNYSDNIIKESQIVISRNVSNENLDVLSKQFISAVDDVIIIVRRISEKLIAILGGFNPNRSIITTIGEDEILKVFDVYY